MGVKEDWASGDDLDQGQGCSVKEKKLAPWEDDG